MDAKASLKSRLPSRHVTEGPERAPHRSYYYAMGLTTEQIHQPFVGVAAIFKRTPYIADLKPGGRYVAKDLFEAGGVPLLMKTLSDRGYMHGECMTVTGRTMAENLARVTWNADQDVVRPADRPLTATGGVVGLKGNLAPDGAIVEVAGLENLRFSGPARCFDGEEACFDAVKNKAYRDDDVIDIDAVEGTLNVHVPDQELERRQAGWKARRSEFASGYLWKYAEQVGPARGGAVTHPGGVAEIKCYADI